MNLTSKTISQFFLISLLCTLTGQSYSNEISNTYSTSFVERDKSAQIYKFTDNHGNITYSTSVTNDFVQAEKVPISPPPSSGYINDTLKRHETLKTSAEELGKAREAREELRDEEEKKHLERLALLNKARPPQQTVVERNLFVTYPHRPLRPWPYSGYNNPVHLPVSARQSPLMPLPPSSFPSRR